MDRDTGRTVWKCRFDSASGLWKVYDTYGQVVAVSDSKEQASREAMEYAADEGYRVTIKTEETD